MEVGGREGFQGFDLHREVLIRVHSSHRADKRAFQEEHIAHAKTKMHIRQKLVSYSVWGTSGDAAVSYIPASLAGPSVPNKDATLYPTKEAILFHLV